MAIVVVGGHSRNIGKTSVVAGLIAALPELRWTAVKITQYGHGICSANGEACDCATADQARSVLDREGLVEVRDFGDRHRGLTASVVHPRQPRVRHRGPGVRPEEVQAGRRPRLTPRRPGCLRGCAGPATRSYR